MWKYFVCICLFACTISQNDPQRYGTVRMALANSVDNQYGWSTEARREVQNVSVSLSVIGPSFIWTDANSADVLIRSASLNGPCGVYQLNTNEIQIDTTCTQGYTAVRQAISHELIHWYLWKNWRWSGHLCWWRYGEAVPTGCHPTLLCQRCLMSPSLTGTFNSSEVEFYQLNVFNEWPQIEDLELVRRCASTNVCQ